MKRKFLIPILFNLIFFVFCSDFNEILKNNAPKTVFTSQNIPAEKKCGAMKSEHKSQKNEIDEALPDKKLFRGFERFVKTDVFGNPYPDKYLFYRNVLSDEFKNVYDEIYKGLMEGNQIITLMNRIKDSEVVTVLDAVFFDNPEIFWWDGTTTWYYNSDTVVTEIEFEFLFPAEQIEEYSTVFYAKALPVLFYANLLENDIDKIKYIHDYLCLSIDYDYESFNNNDISHLQTAYSAIVDYKTVCAGYAKAFSFYLQQLDIPSVVMSNDGHAWNFLSIEGDFYQMDVTWNDDSDIPPYFNLSHSEMQKVSDHHLSKLANMVVNANPTVSNKFSYQKQFGNTPIGKPYTYQEFNNLLMDIEYPFYAKIIK